MPTETAPDWFMRTGTCHRSLLIVVAALLLTACVHRVTLHGRDGERLEGKWRHAQQGNGVIQLLGPDGERLGGTLTAVPRRSFLQQYAAVFGANSIDAEGPDLSAYGHGLWVLPGNSNALAEAVHGESFAAATVPNARMVRGPLFFWTTTLRGAKERVIQCFLIGSSHSARGLGRCKGPAGKEYTVEF
jgi:hypothetical protein